MQLTGEEPERDVLHAAYRLIFNHEAVVRFSLRGPGTPGQPPVSAPLADPNALAATQYHDAADAGEGSSRWGLKASQTATSKLLVTSQYHAAAETGAVLQVYDADVIKG